MKLKRLAVWSLAITIAAVGFACAPRATDAIYTFSPQLKLDNHAALAPALSLMERYLNEVDRRLPSSHNMISHNISGMYGSGFLRMNLVGNDLDYFANVHLGKLTRRELSSAQLATALLERIDVYCRVARQVAEEQQSAELALHHFMQTYPRAGLPADQPTHRDLTASIERVLAGQPYTVGVQFRGSSILSTLDATSLYLPLVTNAQFFSNRVDQAPGTFAGIRAISLQVYFSVEFDSSSSESSPAVLAISTLAPSRNVSQLWQQAMSGVFASQKAAEAFQAQELAHQVIGSKRLPYAQGFLGAMAFEQNVRRYPIKFLKRLHAYRDALAPVLPASFITAADLMLSEGLRSHAAMYADQIKSLADNLRVLAEQPALLELFVASGDVPRVLQFLRTAQAQLEADAQPELANTLATLAAVLDRIEATYKQPLLDPSVAIRSSATELVDVGYELVRTLSISEERMNQWLAAGQAFMSEMGFRPVRTYVDAEGKITLAKGDLSCGGQRDGLRLALEREQLPLYGDHFLGIDEEAEARDQLPLQTQLPRPYLYYIRCSGEAPMDHAFEERLNALRRDDFGQLRRSST